MSAVEELARRLGVPLPRADEVCYVPPSPNGARKSCKSCMMFVTAGQCAIHAPEQKIYNNNVCSYWVGGEPMPAYPSDHEVQYLTPALSGLIRAPGGTSCDICKWFDAPKTCRAVQTGSGQLSTVEPRGCCARWDRKS